MAITEKVTKKGPLGTKWGGEERLIRDAGGDLSSLDELVTIPTEPIIARKDDDPRELVTAVSKLRAIVCENRANILGLDAEGRPAEKSSTAVRSAELLYGVPPIKTLTNPDARTAYERAPAVESQIMKRYISDAEYKGLFNRVLTAIMNAEPNENMTIHLRSSDSQRLIAGKRVSVKLREDVKKVLSVIKPKKLPKRVTIKMGS